MSVAHRSAARLSRRTLLLLALGTTTVATGGWLLKRFGRGAAERWYRALVVFPAHTAVGSLHADTSAVLSAFLVALLPAGIATKRYEAQLRWRAANRAGYRDLYERFAAALDGAARAAGSTTFVNAEPATQQRIVARVARVRHVVGDRDVMAAFRIALFERDWLLFERYISRDVIALFAQTDAWLAVGYPSHPGVARGLDSYRQPVPPAA